MRDPPGALLPFGGIAAQKGFGLSLVVDILSGALSGAGCTHEAETRPGNGIFVTVINIASFVELAGFNEEVDRFVKYVKSAQKLTLCGRNLHAGRTRISRTREAGTGRNLY